MFTGLIQEVGTLRAAGRRGGYLTLEVSYEESRGKLRTGDSMAVDGVCLTATSTGKGVFSADLSRETQKGSTLGDLKVGDRVNLERPVTASDPLGGHIVLGHVDAVGRLRRVTPTAGGLKIQVEAPPEVMKMVVEKGSVAVDGVSLTVSTLSPGGFEIFLIPETQARTTLGGKRAGGTVNLESDYVAKLVHKFLPPDIPDRSSRRGGQGED